MLRTAALFLALVAGASAASYPEYPKTNPFSYGHGVFTYGPLHCTPRACDVVPSCNRAHWATNIEAYNKQADPASQFSNVYTYGGDIEFWAQKGHDGACHAPASMDKNQCNISIFYDPQNAAAAEVYRNTTGVKSTMALIDSRMDGWEQIKTYNNFDGCKFGDFYPNLVNLTDAGLVRLANETAKLYCAQDIIDGVQVDLEPYKEPYRTNLQKYVTAVAKNFYDEDKEFGCRNDNHPNGRTVAYFTFAHNHKPDFTTGLGPNGYYVFSGYDLFPKTGDGGFMYNSPDEFADRLRTEISYIRPVIGDTGHFTLALPLGASCHEYEQYVPMKGDGCGPACEPLTNTARMHEYAQKAFDVLLDANTTKATNGLFCLEDGKSQFLGITWWSYSYQMTYPPMKWFDNEFLPGQPPPAALQVSADNLKKLSDGKTTCVSGPAPTGCTAAGGRPNGCDCEHSWDCKSEWCEDATCKDKPAVQVTFEDKL
jgi:hypothetical protein|eukprot:g6531.t1